MQGITTVFTDGLILEILGTPPSANHAFVTRHAKKGGHHFQTLTAPAREYQELAQKAAQDGLELGWRWLGSWVRLTFQYYHYSLTRGDLSNAKKVLEDGIAKGLNVNDKFFLWHDNVPILDRTQESRVVITISQDETQGVLEI